MKKLLKKIFLVMLFIYPIFSVVSAADDQFAIIPDSEIEREQLGEVVERVSSNGGQVWENYNKEAQKLTLAQQFATGIMTRDTLLDYATYLVRFVGQVALFVAALAIIWLGYKKASTILTEGGNSTTLVKIISGLLVVIFAYVIVKSIVSMFIS